MNNSQPDLHSALSQLPAPDNRKLKMTHTVAIFAYSAGIPDQNPEFQKPLLAVKREMRLLSGLVGVRALMTLKTRSFH